MSSHQLDREIATYEARSPHSKALQEEASRYLPGGSSREPPTSSPTFLCGPRRRPLRLRCGRQPVSGLHDQRQQPGPGHAYPAIVEALGRQAGKGLSFSVPVESQLRLARLIYQRVPSVDTVRFCTRAPRPR